MTGPLTFKFQPGTRVRHKGTDELGTIIPGGRRDLKLITWDGGGSEYVSVDLLAKAEVPWTPAPDDGAAGTPTPPPAREVPAGGVAAFTPTKRKGPRVYWTEEKIIDAIQTWNREHGHPPKFADWKRSTEDHPNAHVLIDRFGSWAAGIEAAGYPRPAQGRNREGSKAPGTPVDIAAELRKGDLVLIWRLPMPIKGLGDVLTGIAYVDPDAQLNVEGGTLTVRWAG